ncbi:MAG: DUF4249 family protein [Bacteroidales bacterium]|nr:DUF4249 family protein [Bacteroidales bacterium]
MRKNDIVYNVFLIFVMLFIFSSCEKRFDWDFDDTPQDVLAVEGIITNQSTFQKIKLSMVRGDPNLPSIPVTDASVSVSKGGQTYIFEHDSIIDGMYVSQQQFGATVGTQTHLTIVHNGKTYKATDVMINITASFRINLSADSQNPGWYYFPSNESYFYSSEQAMWIVDADWSFLPDFQDKPADSCKAKVFYFSLKNIDVNQLFAQGRQSVKVPEGAQVIQTKYSLSPEHAEFWRSVLLETDWRGGYFDVSQGEVFTNISGNAVGFFGASAVFRETFIVGQ